MTVLKALPIFTLLLAEQTSREKIQDDRVTRFLEKKREPWCDMNVSAGDGKILCDLIIQNKYTRALANFEEAGLSRFIDARPVDAHEPAKELEGPFDFVLCDADKEWYKNY